MDGGFRMYTQIQVVFGFLLLNKQSDLTQI